MGAWATTRINTVPAVPLQYHPPQGMAKTYPALTSLGLWFTGSHIEPALPSPAGQMTDAAMLAFILRRVRASTLFLAPYEKLQRKFLKLALQVSAAWSRMLAWHAI